MVSALHALNINSAEDLTPLLQVVVDSVEAISSSRLAGEATDVYLSVQPDNQILGARLLGNLVNNVKEEFRKVSFPIQLLLAQYNIPSHLHFWKN